MHRGGNGGGGGDKRQAADLPPGGGPAAKRPGSAAANGNGAAGPSPPPPRGPTADSDDLDGLIEEEALERGRAAAAAARGGAHPPPPEDEEDDDEDGVRLGGGGADDAAAVALGAAGRNWRRPTPSPLDPSTQPLIFQQLEVDYCIMPVRRDVPPPVPRPPYSSSTIPLPQQQGQQRYQQQGPPQNQREAAVVRLFGVDDQGCSVAVFVHGFEPYFYVERPRDWGPEDVEELRRALNERLAEKARSAGVPAVSSITTETLTPAWGCQAPPAGNGARPFLRVAVALPTVVAPARSLLEGGTLSVAGRGGWRFPTYESNVLYALRFMIDSAMGGGAWVELPPGSYRLRTHQQQQQQNGAGNGGGNGGNNSNPSSSSAALSPSGPLVIPHDSPDPSHQPLTYCQREAHVHAASVVAHAPEGEWSRLAPLRVLSVDIECCGRKGHFPDATQDPVIQVASLVTVVGESHPRVRNVLTLGGCSPIVGAEVEPFRDEASLLQRWQQLVLETDPDVLIGYNIQNFDLPYLHDRAKALGIADARGHQWGRVRGSRLRMRDSTFSSKAYGTHDYKDIAIEGRVQFDLMWAVQRDHKLSSYSLNAVSAHFLGEQKEDVHHSAIADLQNGTDETRRRLAVYCLKDAYLPQRLLDRLMYVYNYVEMARVTGVPYSYLLSRGQSIKVFSQVLRKARARGFVVPTLKPTGGGPNGGAGGGGPGSGGDTAYEGATVLEPKIGYYKGPIATLDFASLYPSIMMAHNLCYTSLLTPESAARLPPESVARAPSGELFAKSDVVKGLLPEILEELLAARKRAKNDLKKESDPAKRAVLDGRQLALKVSANSVYGFTGATVGKMPCLAISAATTAYGRGMIESTRGWVQERYTIANGYPADAVVVYGDTDSVMVDFKVASVEKAMELGREAAERISQRFPPPVRLEFEKVYCPYLLMNKKRYAGLLWTNPDKWDKMDSKGIETVRRDNCGLVRSVVATVLDMILIQRDEKAAAAYVKGVISDLLMGRVDMSLLVVTKALAQEAEEYKVRSAHVELAAKMRKRDAATAPAVGDRVAYVIVKGAKGAKAYEKAEDPIYALEHNVPVDVQHYLDHHLAQPLLRIFEPVLKNPRELLSGEHTRAISVATPSAAAGGIMRFARVRATCLGCRAPLPDPPKVAAAGAGAATGAGGDKNGDGKGAADQQGGACGGADDAVSRALCKACLPRGPEVYARALQGANALERQFARLWSQCQRCQGSLHDDVLCTSRDCPIFYRRKKVQKDLTEAHATLGRFGRPEEW